MTTKRSNPPFTPRAGGEGSVGDGPLERDSRSDAWSIPKSADIRGFGDSGRISSSEVESALADTRALILAECCPEGHWEGELSSSALSTATAATALSIFARETKCPDAKPIELAGNGLTWLANHQNADGGWGDTVRSKSNISTTALCWAAFGAVPGGDASFANAVHRAERWLVKVAGGIQVNELAPAIIRRYGKDRTFSVPILTMCALAGRFGTGRDAWKHVIPLPFELAACPRAWFAPLRMPVVSYALPALIAIGQARHKHFPSRNPLARAARHLTRGRTLNVLGEIQPESGGFLEATPLTSFVVMSLAGSGQASHRVARKGIDFLIRSVRPDGSWPIDTNLSTWLTTLSIEAVGPGVQLPKHKAVLDWLLGQQYRTIHPYTGAAPGGWAWTDLSGGVPDADDTAGALIALHTLTGGKADAQLASRVEAGLTWLLGVQNRDGGIPTFCRGWGHLPFDMSSPDITAHAIRAWNVWLHTSLPSPPVKSRLESALSRARRFLIRMQRPEGDWTPLWFGNEDDPHDENHVYGTAKVLQALWPFIGETECRKAIERAVRRLLDFQQQDGAWSGALGGTASIEETALAVGALSAWLKTSPQTDGPEWNSLCRGTNWLIQQLQGNALPSPIGFYFAKLWYFERLYPLIFAVGALRSTGELLRIIEKASKAH